METSRYVGTWHFDSHGFRVIETVDNFVSLTGDAVNEFSACRQCLQLATVTNSTRERRRTPVVHIS
jgi:hypothetical protein